MLKSRFFFICCLLMFWADCSVFSQKKPFEALDLAIQKLATDPDLAHGQLGICVISAKSGEIVASWDEGKSLVPASTLKLMTSGAALSLLGEDHRFVTRLEYDGIIDTEGVLKGNLYIKGGGDPALGSGRIENTASFRRILMLWTEAVREAGIKKIQGAVIADASCFEDAMVPRTWQWADLGNYYGAGASCLSINENLYKVYFSSGKTPGEPVKLLRIEPEIPWMEFINEVTAGAAGTGDNAYIFGSPYTGLRYIRGTIPPGRTEFSIKGSISDPALFAAFSLEEKLKAQGIVVDLPPGTIRLEALKGNNSEGNRTTIHSYKGATLKEIVYWLNKKSVNLYAEQLLKALGEMEGNQGSTESGILAVEEFWLKAGIDMKGFHMEDGSGLSRANAITAEQMARALLYMKRSKNDGAFYASLAVAGDPGDPGTISNLCKGTTAANNLRAKSGSINRVRSYAGYVNTLSGDQLCFALIANNFTCSSSRMKRKFEALMIELSEVGRK